MEGLLGLSLIYIRYLLLFPFIREFPVLGDMCSLWGPNIHLNSIAQPIDRMNEDFYPFDYEPVLLVEYTIPTLISLLQKADSKLRRSQLAARLD